MDIEIIIQILGLIIGFLPYLFKLFWPEEVPKTIEDFNDKYEDKINRILSNYSNKSSELLEGIINNNINLKGESNSEEYALLLDKHRQLLIKIRLYVEFENKYKEIEEIYVNLNNSFKNMKLLGLCLVIASILGIIYFIVSSNEINLLLCGILTLIIYVILECISLYRKFNKDSKCITDFKKFVLDESKNNPKLSDGYEY